MLVTNRIGEFTKHLNFPSGCHIVLIDWSLCLSHSHTLTLSLRPAIFLPPRNRSGQAHSSRPSNGSQANTTSYIISYRRGQAHLSRRAFKDKMQVGKTLRCVSQRGLHSEQCQSARNWTPCSVSQRRVTYFSIISAKTILSAKPFQLVYQGPRWV